MQYYIQNIISGSLCKTIVLSSTNASEQDGLKMTGKYEMLGTLIRTTHQRQATYYNSITNTSLLMSNQGVWMVGYF